MFGCILAGRLVQSDARRISQTQFIFDVPDCESNHVVVFLLGNVPLPDGCGAAVYFGWPSSTQQQAWQLLGYISNHKPSAIFRVVKSKDNELFSQNHSFGIPNSMAASTITQIGLSIEPLDQLKQQTPISGSAPSTVDSFAQFTTKMLNSFCNYVASFATTQSQMVPNAGESFVPMGVVQKWYENFQRRITTNPNFWKS